MTRYDLSSLRLITSAGAPLGAALAGECAQRLGCRVKQAYGMTESGGATEAARRPAAVHVGVRLVMIRLRSGNLRA